jgi:DNA-binding transcriptional regulator YiaG
MSLLENAKREQVEVPVHIPTSDGKAVAETIMVKVEGIRDAKTGELFLDGNALELLDKAKARYMGLLLPEEIKALRQRLNLTQREMSDLLQIGDKTYTRWESGRSRPSQVLNLLLRALRDGRLDVAYLRSQRTVSFNWHLVFEAAALPAAVSLAATEPGGPVLESAARGVPTLRGPNAEMEPHETCLDSAANEELALAA